MSKSISSHVFTCTEWHGYCCCTPQGPLGCTPLFFAQSEEVAEALLKAGAALGHLDEAGRTGEQRGRSFNT